MLPSLIFCPRSSLKDQDTELISLAPTIQKSLPQPRMLSALPHAQLKYAAAFAAHFTQELENRERKTSMSALPAHQIQKYDPVRSVWTGCTNRHENRCIGFCPSSRIQSLMRKNDTCLLSGSPGLENHHPPCSVISLSSLLFYATSQKHDRERFMPLHHVLQKVSP